MVTRVAQQPLILIHSFHTFSIALCEYVCCNSSYFPTITILFQLIKKPWNDNYITPPPHSFSFLRVATVNTTEQPLAMHITTKNLTSGPPYSYMLPEIF